MNYILAFLSFFFLSSYSAFPAHAAEELEIGRMRVVVWPEYDSTGVLFIYDGRFKNNEAFPNETSFFIPSGGVISDACSLSPKGQHFCQLYTQKKLGDIDEVSLKLPYPNFYLSFHTDPFTSAGEKRVLHHTIRSRHKIDRLEVDVQSPLRADGFSVNPAGFERSEKKGFVHFEKVFENVEKGQLIAIDIEYTKADRRPSVDIKYSPMSQGSGASPYQSQKGFFTVVYIASLAGLAVLLGLIFLVVKSKGKKDA